MQEYNGLSARLQAGLLFLATIGLLIPIGDREAEPSGRGLIGPATIDLLPPRPQ